ncbi:MAG: hypothetical protein KJ573_09340 [Proteobacteria bacterium]|nr:hypothetical protein [Pseudomonadota bacterium]MBU1903777.1 hypothetical protein [Pseudomonadota bacterium]
MLYYIYFDSYGYAREVLTEEELAEKYNNNPEEFLRATCSVVAERDMERSTGHVGTLRFDNEDELKDYLDSLGEEIKGFYGCQSESRPYNF